MKAVVAGLLLAVSMPAALAAAAAGPGGETPPPTESSMGPHEVEALIEQAEAARRAAAERNAEWLATRGLIKQARRAADEGNWPLAADLAGQALQQGNLAVEQAERESEAWHDRVVR